MSYILDALKKSEAEQDPAAAASLAVNQQRNQPRYRLTSILVVVALLINVGVLLWLFGPAERAATPPPPVAQNPADHDILPATASATAPAATPQPALAPASVVDPVESTPLAATEPALPDPLVNARLADLPAAVRERFPGLAFSTHIYAEDPDLRAVVANGRRLVEGDDIDGAAVESITETGVILAFENYLVEIPVVTDWE